MSSEERFLSAVVVLKPAQERPPLTEPDPMGLSDDLRAIGRAKAHLVSAGFEVEAPLGLSFAIAAPRYVFEKVFGTAIDIDDESLGGRITVEGGGSELPTEVLPEEIRADVRSISFAEPPSFLG